MKVVWVLVISFMIALFSIRLLQHRYDWKLAGCIAMAAMLVFTSIGHFVFVKGMTMMLPPFVPFRKELIYLTGIIEIVAAIGLLIPSLRVVTGCWLIIFFIMLLPANIYAAIKHIDLEKATFDGSGLSYLWFRVPLQLFFIIWTYCCTIRY